MNEENITTGVETRIPDFSRKTANLHYQSDLTGEIGTILIRPSTTEDDIMSQYSAKFPKECSVNLKTIQDISLSLNSETGRSKLGHMGALARIPEIVYTAMKFLNNDYWLNKKTVYRFIRKYPKFSIGNHNPKRKDSNVIVH